MLLPEWLEWEWSDIGKDDFKKDFQFFRFAAYGFLKNLNFYEPFLILFFRSLGLSFLKIGFLFSISEIATYILEIPTGIFADAYGRRKAMVASMLSYIAAFSTFYFSSNYILLSIAMVLLALGDTFRSGTHKSMIYEYLKIKRMYDLKVEYYGATRSFSQLGSAFNAILSAAVVILTNDYRKVFLFALIPYSINLVNLATYPKELEGEKRGGKRTVKEFASIFRSWEVLKPIMNSAMFDGFFKTAKEYLQPILKSFALSLPIFLSMNARNRTAIVVGVVYFFVYIMTSRASRNAGKVVKKVKSIEKAANSLFILAATSITLAGIFLKVNFSVISILSLMTIYILQNLRKPVMVAYISSKAPSSALTSTLSVESQLKTFFTAAATPFIGWLADTLGIGSALAVLGGMMFIIYPVLKIK